MFFRGFEISFFNAKYKTCLNTDDEWLINWLARKEAAKKI